MLVLTNVVSAGIFLAMFIGVVAEYDFPLQLLISLVNCWPHFVQDLMTYRRGSSSVPVQMKKDTSLKVFKVLREFNLKFT